MQEIGILPSLKLFVSAIIDDAKTVFAHSQRTNIGNIKKYYSHQSPE